MVVLNACQRVGFQKKKKITIIAMWSAEEELRSFTARGEKLLCSLVVWQWKRLYYQTAAEQPGL